MISYSLEARLISIDLYHLCNLYMIIICCIHYDSINLNALNSLSFVNYTTIIMILLLLSIINKHLVAISLLFMHID
jgi:hypothetical protein